MERARKDRREKTKLQLRGKQVSTALTIAIKDGPGMVEDMKNPQCQKMELLERYS